MDTWHSLFTEILQYEHRVLQSFQIFTSLQEQLYMIRLSFFNWNKCLQIGFALFNLL